MVDRRSDVGRRVRTEGLAVVVPSTWWRIPLLQRPAREASVKSLLKQQFADTGASASLRHETEQALLEATADSARQRGVILWISTETVEGFPMAMSLLMTDLDPFFVRGFEHAAEQLTSRDRVATTRMRPGRVLRHVYHRLPGTEIPRITGLDAPATPMNEATETLQADYWLERPDGRVTQLAFSTPLTRYEGPLLELFDTVVDSVSWTDDETRPHGEATA
ncbi:MAG: hypothetical protein ABWX74_15420 [Aeromicrobium sp.]